MARLSPPTDWQALETDADWKAHRGGVIVVHQRMPLPGEAPAKYHGRNYGCVQHGLFRERVARGADNSEWFCVPDAAGAKRGDAVACDHCLGE